MKRAMTMTGTPSQRIAAVLRAKGIEVPPSDIDPWITRMYDRFSIAHPRISPAAFAESLAEAIEDGHPAWVASLHSAFGVTL